MGFGVRQRPRSSDGCPVSYCGTASKFIPKKLFAQLFEATEVVIFHVPARLVQLRGNLAQRVTIDEEQLQGSPLVLGTDPSNIFWKPSLRSENRRPNPRGLRRHFAGQLVPFPHRRGRPGCRSGGSSSSGAGRWRGGRSSAGSRTVPVRGKRQTCTHFRWIKRKTS